MLRSLLSARDGKWWQFDLFRNVFFHIKWNNSPSLLISMRVCVYFGEDSCLAIGFLAIPRLFSTLPKRAKVLPMICSSMQRVRTFSPNLIRFKFTN